LSIIAVLIIVSIVRGLGLLEVFLLAIAAAVSAIPESLPAVVTVVLAKGLRTMAHRHAIIRRLVAVETLGSATVICSDKTGTLTLNQMTVRKIYVNGKILEVTGEGYHPKGEFLQDNQKVNAANNQDLWLHLQVAALCNDADLKGQDSQWNILGDPTEGALLVASMKAGLSKEEIRQRFPG
jgi:Ca2+-transporting ATPase